MRMIRENANLNFWLKIPSRIEWLHTTRNKKHRAESVKFEQNNI